MLSYGPRGLRVVRLGPAPQQPASTGVSSTRSSASSLTRSPGAEPPVLAEYLVRQGVLTDFQAECSRARPRASSWAVHPHGPLGAGSMGTVYKALSKTDSKWYAVKVLPRRSMWNVRIARGRFGCSSSAAAPFGRPVHRRGHRGRHALPRLAPRRGETLEKIRPASRGSSSAEQSAQYACRPPRGCRAAHQAGLFHGLLKPSNLMLGPDGDRASSTSASAACSRRPRGSRWWTPCPRPTRLTAGSTAPAPRSAWTRPTSTRSATSTAWAACLYFFLTGRPFPDGTAVEKMMGHQHKQPTPVKEIDSPSPTNWWWWNG